MRVMYSALYSGENCIPIEVDETVTVHNPLDLSTNDGFLVIWGGEDISPHYYGETVGRYTGAENLPSKRDALEAALAQRAMEIGMPIVGICRGAQLMCALSGGKLVQHVTGHAGFGGHDMETDDGRVLLTNSLHHQMMFPWKVDHKLIAWTPKRRSTVYLGENDRPIAEANEMPEPEIVWFPKTKSLGIQGHPEFINDIKDPFVSYCVEKINAYVSSV